MITIVPDIPPQYPCEHEQKEWDMESEWVHPSLYLGLAVERLGWHWVGHFPLPLHVLHAVLRPCGAFLAMTFFLTDGCWRRAVTIKSLLMSG